MADIFDLSSLVRRDDNVDAFEKGADALTYDADTGEATLLGADGTPLDRATEGLIDFSSRNSRARLDPTLDWSNQELADLYRVQRLLGQAGVAVDTDRGVTDEGDPWFVFLDAQGEVFVHLSRIDREYVLDSAVQDGIVTGPCFSTLIERFAGRAESSAAMRPDGATVISMNRRGKIVMHPGAALAALIWTILLATDELVFLEEPIASASDLPRDAAESESTEGVDPSEDVAGTGLEDSPSPEFEALFASREDATTFLAEAKAERGGQAELRETTQSSMQAVNATALTGMGLTALAAAYGISRQQSTEEPVDDTPDVQIALLDGHHEPTTPLPAAHGTETKDGVAQHAAAGRIFVGEEADNAGRDLSEAPMEANGEPTTASEHPVSEVRIDAAGVTQGNSEADAAAEDMASDGRVTTPAYETPADMDRAETAVADASTRQTQPDAVGAARFSQLLESVGLEDLLDEGEAPIILSGLRSIDTSRDLFQIIDESLIDVTIAAPGDDGDAAVTVRSSQNDVAPIEVPTLDALAIQGPKYRFEEFNDDVRDYIDHMLLNSDIEVIALENQILLIDTRALAQQGAEAFALTWSLDEDRMVSTIGVKADFEAFDLIA